MRHQLKHKLARHSTKEYLDEVNDLHKSTTKHRLTQAMAKYKPQPLMLSELRKNQSLGDHMIFSMDNPSHGQHDGNAHPNMLSQLKSMGADVHEAQGKYGKPERSIIVRSPSEQIRNHVVSSAHANGQDSIILSNGNEHKMVYLNGEHVGMHHAGIGTQYHEQEPEDFYTKMSNGTMFSHNFDFDKLHKAGVVSPPKGMNLKQMTQIKQDNYVGANGKDYSAEELNDGIVRAKTNLAAKMKLIPPKVSNAAPSFPPPMPMKKEELDKGLKGDWTQDSNYSIHHSDMPDSEPDHGHHLVEVKYKNQPVAQLRYFKQTPFGDNKSPELYSGRVDVSRDHQRKGIASAMYNEAQSRHGVSFTPSQHQTPAAKKFWANPNRLFGKSEVKKADKKPYNMNDEIANTIAQLKAHKERHAATMAQPKPQAPAQAASVVVPQSVKPTNSSQLENLTAPVYVNIHQHRSAVLNNIPNPVRQIQHLDDVHKLNQYHGKDVIESVSPSPKQEWGHETYRVNPDKSMHLMDSHYDSSDSKSFQRR